MLVNKLNIKNGHIRIRTGKELLDSNIKKFEVVNGAWIGEIGIRNNQPYLYCNDYNGNLVNSFPINNNTELDLTVKPLSYESNKSNLLKKYKTCSRCVHDEEGDGTISGSTCYLCRRNPVDNRIDWFEEVLTNE